MERLADQTDRGVLAFYHQEGQRLGHSPNPWFDEPWYRAAHPAVARALEAGEYVSGMDHYCRRGHSLDRRPHWLFDERYYRLRYRDLTDETLRERRLANGYDHFLRNGNREGRIGHPFFDPAVFLSAFDAETAEAFRDAGPYRVYLTRFVAANPELRTTLFFDADWYRQRYPEVAALIEAGHIRSALEHYLTNDTADRFDPLPQFSESWYAQHHEDVATAVAQRQIRNGYVHFLINGLRESRSPAPGIDLRWYGAQELVAADLAARKAPDPFTHLLRFGLAAGLPTGPAPEEHPADVTPAVSPDVAAREVIDRALLPTLGRLGLDFTVTGTPELSVVIAPANQFAVLLPTLAALRDSLAAGVIDLIIVDRGSSDATRLLTGHVKGAQILRFETRIDPHLAWHAGLQCALAPHVLFLTPDARPVHGAVRRALDRLRQDPSIEVVGGKTIGADGRLLDGGGIIRVDGEVAYHAPGADPSAPEANVRRDADFVAPSFVMGRTRSLREIDAFTQVRDALDHAAADLCLRLRSRGGRVVYDPAIVTLRPAGDGPVNTPETRERIRGWDAGLLSPVPADGIAIPPCPVRRDARRILYVDDSVPLRLTGSGFVRSNDIIHAMADLGYAVTVFPILGCRHDLASVYADMPETVEVLHDRSLADFPAFLAQRAGWYDTIWVSRVHNLDLVAASLRDLRAVSGDAPRLILDTEAIASERRHARLGLIGQSMDLGSAIEEELANGRMCDHVIAVSPRDARTLVGAGFASVSVLGHVRAPAPTPRAFADRAGMLFVGAIHEVESPNHDSLVWFVDEVLPLVERELGWETRLTIVGYTAPSVSMERFEDHPRVTLRGAVADLTSLYDSHRLFVAPTRFAAGLPYKVHEAASFGLPVVATTLLAEQLDWRDGVELAAVPTGDAAAMAQRIVGLYRDEETWQRLRSGALHRLAHEHAPDGYQAPLRVLLGGPRE